jgi:hypothetical protein
MNIEEKLDNLRLLTPECNLVGFGDLRAQIILRTSSEKKCPQEYLDEICRQAREGFAAQDTLARIDGHDPELHNSLVILTRGETRIVVRPERQADDMLFCVCQTPEAAWGLETQVRRTLHDICGSV